MENRLQHVFLAPGAMVLASTLSFVAPVWANADADAPSEMSSGLSSINSEVFELGVAAGVINIADFSSEITTGLSATFRASEDFFLQGNFFQTTASPSSYELSQGKLFDGDERTFRHYDLLVGYNLYQGEFFKKDDRARLSALYLVAGVGDTQFGGEDNFTYTLGIGYQAAITRRFIWRVDYRSYIYTSNLVSDEDRTVSSTQFSSGLSFLF